MSAPPSWASPLQAARALAPLERGLIAAVAYADVFDFPLTWAEAHRYLVGVAAPPAATVEAARAAIAAGYLAAVDGHLTLADRTHLVERRSACEAHAARLWPRARSYGALLARLPFARLVAVSGALAVNNVEPGADIDYFIVTEPGRLWCCRALVIGVVRLAARRGDRLCPNYFVSEDALVLDDRTLFTAHELVQLVPLAGAALYARLRRANPWTRSFLPNADGPPEPLGDSEVRRRFVTRAVEAIGRSPLLAGVERWERERKVRKFAACGDAGGETRFGVQWCKGHFDAHGRRVLGAFADRLRTLGLMP